MNLFELSKLSDEEIASWVKANTGVYTLLPSRELENIVDARDDWEEKATVLANKVGDLLGEDFGDHTSANCPVENAINA